MYLSKNLASASSSLGSISTAAVAVTTLAATPVTLDTQRRLTFLTTTAADFSAVFVTVTGAQDGGNSITEVVRLSTTSTVVTAFGGTTTQDFKTISSVTASCGALGQPILIQTNGVGGTPWIPVNTCVAQTNIGFNLTYSSTATAMSTVLEYSFDNPPGQGQQNPTSSFSRPLAITSTSISTVANTNSAGACVLPIACWRMTLTSTSTAGTTTTSSLKVYLAALQTGLGSGL